MFKRLFLVMLSAAPLAWADAYKGIGPDGRVFYSDRPLPDTTRVPLPAPPRAAPPTVAPEAAGDPGPYEQFAILNPQPGTTLAAGEVRVGIVLDPPLRAGHSLRVTVNDAPVTGVGNSMQMILRGLEPGSHRLNAAILDDRATPIATTATVHFHLRPSVAEQTEPNR